MTTLPLPVPARRQAAALNNGIWATLSKVDVSQHIEKKAGFSYLSWPWAWALVKEQFPDATFTKHLFGDHKLPYMIDDQGWAYVQVTVTILQHSLTEVFPVLSHNNRPIKNPDSFAVNTALMRGLVKTLAYHGLGLSLYVGEDLPMETKSKAFNVAEVIDDEAAPTAGIDLISSLRSTSTLRQLNAWRRDHESEAAELEQHEPAAWSRVKAAYLQRRKEVA
jgi:hypothetical protein